MAKGKKKSKKQKRRLASGANSTATSLEDDQTVEDLVDETGTDGDEAGNDVDSNRVETRSVARGPSAGPRQVGRAAAAGGISLYKPGQGYYTRVGTAIFAFVLIAAGWNFLYDRLEVYYEPDQPWTYYLQIGIPSLVAVGFGFLVYWLAGRNRRSCDFMIMTEGEMKKVSWSSRKEVIGSTIVVIVVVILMAVLLFLVDLIFAWFFHKIGVLHLAPQVFGKGAGT